MARLALGLWIVTALGGTYLWSMVVSRSRTGTPGARPSRLPELVMFTHPLLALTGLGVWIAYLYRDAGELAWVAFGFIAATAVLGGVLHLSTVKHRGEGSAEQQQPNLVVHGHGALATATLVLVFLTALGVG